MAQETLQHSLLPAWDRVLSCSGGYWVGCGDRSPTVDRRSAHAVQWGCVILTVSGCWKLLISALLCLNLPSELLVSHPASVSHSGALVNICPSQEEATVQDSCLQKDLSGKLCSGGGLQISQLTVRLLLNIYESRKLSDMFRQAVQLLT